jgi:hypothetical protein
LPSVVNAANIQVQGTSTDMPTVQGPPLSADKFRNFGAGPVRNACTVGFEIG